MKLASLNIKGQSVAYRIEGAGSPIILLHGWPQSSHMWRKIVPAMAAEHSVVLIDLPGLGESQSHGQFDTGFVAGVVADTLEALGVSDYHMVGHDIGAWVAASFALQFEHRLKSLTVMDAGIPGLIPDQIFKPGNAQRVWQFYFHAVADIPELLTEGRELEYLSWYFRNKAVVKGAITDQDVALYAKQYSYPRAMSNGFGYYRAFTESAAQNCAFQQKLSLPVLAVGAESGVGASIGLAMEKIASNVITRVIPDCGHYIPEERPEAFVELLLAFVKSTK